MQVFPPIVQKILADFVESITAIESLAVEGIYLTGSLPMNDFHADKSDIDFLVFCKELPDLQMARLLKHVHANIARQYHKPDLSGAYVTLTGMQSSCFEAIKTLTYHEGKMRFRFRQQS